MYLMETVMYMLVIMVKLPRGIMVRNRGSSPGTRSIRWNVLEEQNITSTKRKGTDSRYPVRSAMHFVAYNLLY
jgi:hypothetical protein